MEMEIKKTSQLYQVEALGRELIEYEVSVGPDLQWIGRWRLVVSPETMELLGQLKKITLDVAAWPLPEGRSTSAMLIRELIAKVRGEWVFPASQEELCHCRGIGMEKVDQAILSGAYSVEKIRRFTSANTGCGTCLPLIQTLLRLRGFGE